MKTRQLDVVTPLLRSDFDHYKLQLRSLQEHYKIDGTFYALVHRNEADATWVTWLQSLDPRVKVLYQEDLLHPSAVNLSGWYVQQLTKLAMASVVTADAYICLDADTLLGKPVTYDDLAPGGLPLYNCVSAAVRTPLHVAYIQHSALMMSFPYRTLEYVSEWSTKIMRVDTVKSLQAHLVDSYEMAWDAALVMAFLRNGRLWGEYLLYHIELERTASLHKHTCVEHSLNGAYFWDRGQHVNWTLDAMGPGPFILAGSKGGLSAYWVRERLSDMLPF